MPILDRYIFPVWERLGRKEMAKRLRWVITTEYGVLGYYGYDGNKHIRKAVLAFRSPKKAERIARVLNNRTAIQHTVEVRNESMMGEGTREERRVIRKVEKTQKQIMKELR